MNTYFCTSEEFIKNAKIPTRVMDTEPEMMEEIAQIMFDTIKNNGDEKTVIICPVGPINQYPIFAEKVNKARLSLKNCWFINMDEYLDESGKSISYDNPLSFKATMDRILYSRIDNELLMPENQRVFPCPGREKEIDKLIEDLGKVDCVLTGVGINGHIAFNEPPKADEPITDEQFGNICTRCLDITRETTTVNGSSKLHGALDLFPKRCISLGMKQLLNAKVFKIYMYCPWQWGIMRKITLEDVTRFAPASFLQQHSNAEMIITKDLYDFNL